MTLDIRGGARYASIYLVKLLAILLAIGVLALYLLYSVYSVFPDAVWDADGSALATEALVRFMMFLPLLIPAFLVGCFEPGTTHRLIMRILLNLGLMTVTLTITGDLSYEIHDILVDESSGITIGTMGMELDVTMLGLLLLTIPVCSVLDALMEYRHASDPRRRSTVVMCLTRSIRHVSLYGHPRSSVEQVHPDASSAHRTPSMRAEVIREDCSLEHSPCRRVLRRTLPHWP